MCINACVSTLLFPYRMFVSENLKGSGKLAMSESDILSKTSDWAADTPYLSVV